MESLSGLTDESRRNAEARKENTGEAMPGAIEVAAPSTAKIAEALAKAQGSFGEIKKNQSMEIQGRKTYRYGDLAAILKAVTPALSENGIAIIQLPVMSGETLTVTTRLIHLSGEEINGSISAPAKGRIQEIGSALTYLRRYSLSAMLNVSADDDTDGDMENAEVSNSKPPKGKMEKLGAEVRDILVALDNADFHDSLSDDWRISFSHLLTNKDGHILDSDKWKDIVEVEDHVNLILMEHRKNISKGATFLKKEFAKWEKAKKKEGEK